MSEILIPYGVEFTDIIPLIARDDTDFDSSPLTLNSGDAVIIEPGASPVNANLTNTPTHAYAGHYEYTLTAAETQKSRFTITIISGDSPKSFEDQSIKFATYGHANAAYAFDLSRAQMSQTAQDNLEDMFDGTGYIEDSAPATQSSIANLAASPGVGARPFVPTNITVTSGTGASGDADDLANDDSDVYTLNDNAGTITLDFDYQIDVDAEVVQFLIIAAMQGNADNVNIQFYDQIAESYVTIDTITGTNSLIYTSFDKIVVSKYTLDGLFQVRLTGTGLSSSTLTINKAVAFGVSTIRSVGYTQGILSYNSLVSNTNTTPFVDGVGDNPVSSFTALNTLLSSTGISTVHATGVITLGASFEGVVVNGDNYTLNLNGQSIDGSVFVKHGLVTGTSTGFGVFDTGPFGAATCAPGVWNNNGFSDAFTANGNGNYQFNNCHSQIAGSGAPSFDFSGQGAAVTAQFRRWSGGITLTVDSNCTISIDAVSGGIVTINGSDGNVQVRGHVTVVDNRTGSPTLGQNNVVNMSKINSEIDAALADYDSPTKAEMDSAFSVINTALAIVDGVVDAILVDTNELQTNQGNWLTATGFATDTALATVDANVDSIKAKTDQLTFTVSGQVDANAESINGAEILGNGTSGNLWRGE